MIPNSLFERNDIKDLMVILESVTEFARKAKFYSSPMKSKPD